MAKVTTESYSNTQEDNPFIVKIPSSSLRSNSFWLTKKSLTIGIAALGTIAAATVAAYYLSTSSISADHTEPSVNQSSLSIFNIYTTVEEKGYDKCKQAFMTHLEAFESCGISMCDCIRNARDVFELHCSSYARNIANTTKQCQEVGLAMQRCIEWEC